MSDHYEWMTTQPSGRAHTCREDAGVTGWKLHAIIPGQRQYQLMNGPVIDVSPALCGLRPRHGWGLDLFINAPCQRCLDRAAKLGIELPALPES